MSRVRGGRFRGTSGIAFQATAQRRMSKGVMLKFHLHVGEGDGSQLNDFGVDGYNVSTPEYWPMIARVVTGFDHTHNFNAAFTAELPFGKGKRMATDGAAAALVGGWQINGLYTAYTGGPFTVTSSGASLNAPGNNQTADQVKASVAIFGNVDQWFDASACAPVTETRFGNSCRNQLRGPGMNNVDLSIYRAFPIRENVGLQFRAEIFNISNKPHFGNPRNDASGAQFGRITGLQNTGREGIDERFLRFGLRLSF